MAHTFDLDRTSDVPVGTQLVWRLRALIGSGRLAPGERLPGVRELAAAAGVNVNTVRSVYARLADQGLIVSEHGRGTFVAEALPPGDELARIAGEASASARAAGVDPRELAAALFAAPPEAGAGHAPAERGAHPFAAEARRRSALRAEIAGLERELAVLELPSETPVEDGGEARRPQPPQPQLLTAAELEAVRDELVARIQPLRADRTVARRERATPRVERRSPAIGADAPSIVAGAGGWTLRWRG